MSHPSNEVTERAAFEAAFADKLDFLRLSPDAEYLYNETGHAWDGWQARASLPTVPAIPRTSAEAVQWLGPHANAWDALNETRKAVADIIGAHPDTWPDHGNAPLAIAAVVAIRQNAMERANATPAPADTQEEK